MSRYLLDVIKEYRIEANLGYIVIDNAPNNNTIITALSISLRRDFKLSYDPIRYRIHYQGHIINLAVKSFLFITDKESIEEDKETNVYAITLKEIEEQRKKGPLRKLHNFVIWLAQSTQRLHQWLDMANIRIPRDNSTRWNSWFRMLQLAWALRDVIDEFITIQGIADLKKD